MAMEKKNTKNRKPESTHFTANDDIINITRVMCEYLLHIAYVFKRIC